MKTTTPLMDQIHGILSTSAYVNNHHLSVEETDGLVRLEGPVDSFFQKQMAQEALRRVDGVEQIENRLKVKWR